MSRCYIVCSDILLVNKLFFFKMFCALLAHQDGILASVPKIFNSQRPINPKQDMTSLTYKIIGTH